MAGAAREQTMTIVISNKILKEKRVSTIASDLVEMWPRKI